jgi:hypothetical protein
MAPKPIKPGKAGVCPPGKIPVPVGGRIVCVDPKDVTDPDPDSPLGKLKKGVIDQIKRQMRAAYIARLVTYAIVGYVGWQVYKEIR